MKLQEIFKNIYFSFPVQLFVLHFKKYQVLLFIWFIIYSIINGIYLKTYGAEALFFAPEYNGIVNLWGNILLGLAWGMFIMSWNITTFILHSKRFKFLAASTHPFLRYCINNSLFPLAFTLFYFIRLYQFASTEELKTTYSIMGDILGIILGFFILCCISFIYFFSTGKKIDRTLPGLGNALPLRPGIALPEEPRYGLKVRYYLSSKLKWKKVQNIVHLKQSYVESVFKRHNLSAITVIIMGFILLATIGFFIDYRVFELPAAACIILFFSILIAVVGALSYFLQSWSLPFAFILLIVTNYLFEHEIIDPRNQAFGLNYKNKEERPIYNKAAVAALCTPAQVMSDKANMIEILDNWKARQTTEKPLMIFINVSGGGLRSAAFTMNSLQQLDSITRGSLMKHTFLISGASGGMLSATYYRELYRRLPHNRANPSFYEKEYAEDITKDLLNPVFTSLVTRDLLATRQNFTVGKFTYTKDRGYAFEKKLGDNTHGLLNASLKEVSADEKSARIPMIIFNAIINSDGRKMIIGSQPLSFLMKPAEAVYDTAVSADAVDFGAMFVRQSPMDMRLVTALRLNASFPYILPNVWLPSKPVIDVMDAGLRDNYGQETSLRFIDNFKDWIKNNTGGVLIIQLRDSRTDNWGQPVVTKTLGDMLVTPATMLQQNWHKLQSYFLTDEYNYFKSNSPFSLRKAEIMYIARVEEKTAAMSLHLTASEKNDVVNSFYNPVNKNAIDTILEALHHNRLQ